MYALFEMPQDHKIYQKQTRHLFKISNFSTLINPQPTVTDKKCKKSLCNQNKYQMKRKNRFTEKQDKKAIK